MVVLGFGGRESVQRACFCKKGRISVVVAYERDCVGPNIISRQLCMGYYTICPIVQLCQCFRSFYIPTHMMMAIVTCDASQMSSNGNVYHTRCTYFFDLPSCTPIQTPGRTLGDGVGQLES